MRKMTPKRADVDNGFFFLDTILQVQFPLIFDLAAVLAFLACDNYEMGEKNSVFSVSLKFM